ncbi:MAG: septum formation initiator family protein [Candidatus Omnitrophota bacterium]
MEKKKIILWFAAAFALVALFLPGYSKYQTLVQRSSALESRIKQLEAANAKLQSEQVRLEEDMTYVEKVLRDKMKVVQKGEIVYRVEGDKESGISKGASDGQ